MIYAIQMVYPNGKGEHFEKTINFEIYKNTSQTPNDSEIMEYLFLGTNDIYYDAVDKCIDKYNDPKDEWSCSINL